MVGDRFPEDDEDAYGRLLARDDLL
jgi:hypothetical protein